MSMDPKPPVIDGETVRRVADLANIALTPEEIESLGGSLQKILTYVAQLDSLPRAEALETSPEPTPERLDQVVPPLAPEVSLAAAPAKSGSSFLVPRIIE